MKQKTITSIVVIICSLVFTLSGHATQTTIEGIGLSTPESVEYYAAEDVYLVTNINGSPFEKDGNGFVSKISPEGEVLNLKWIDGAKPNVRLNAPKGAAINDNLLYIADLDEVHIFRLPGGQQLSSVKIEDTLFLNGITPAQNDSVYVSDSGFVTGFKAGGSDAVYQVFPDGRHKLIIKDTTLKAPNGLSTQGPDIMIGSARSTYIFRLKPDGQLNNIPTPSGMDGLLVLPNGDYLFSSWKDKTIYRMDPAGNAHVVASDLTSPADIGYDSKRNRVLVPIFLENKLVFLTL